MLTLGIIYTLIMAAIFLSRPSVDATRLANKPFRPRQVFDEPIKGPWEYFAREIAPPQRKTF